MERTIKPQSSSIAVLISIQLTNASNTPPSTFNSKSEDIFRTTHLQHLSNMLKHTLVLLCVMSALLIIHIQASPVEDVQQRDHPDKEKGLCCCCCGYCLHCNYATGIELEKADHQTPAFVNATLTEGETQGLCCCCCGYCLHCNKDGAPKLVPKT